MMMMMRKFAWSGDGDLDGAGMRGFENMAIYVIGLTVSTDSLAVTANTPTKVPRHLQIVTMSEPTLKWAP
jgi:hypothetical protein